MLIDEDMNTVPSDWEQPDFELSPGNLTCNWKDYIDSNVADLWFTFNDEQKQALAQSYNGMVC